jgi:hypothetical protein
MSKKFNLMLSDLKLFDDPKESNIVTNLLKKPIKDKTTNTPHTTNETPNAIQQADLLYLTHDDNYKYALVVVDIATSTMDAEALETRDSISVRNALIKIYKRKILKLPTILEVDSGSEFKDEFKTYFKDKLKIHTKEVGRHRQQALVETFNHILGKLIGTYQLSQEVLNKETSRDWIHILPKLVKTINKHYVKEPHIIDAITEPPRASGDSRNILDVGTKVRVQLDNPIGYVEGDKLHGRFRASDIRWNPKI